WSAKPAVCPVQPYPPTLLFAAVRLIRPVDSQLSRGGNMKSRTLTCITAALTLALSPTIFAFAGVTLLQLSGDPFTNSTSQHRTEVEPDTFAFGSTVVSAFQVGRFFDGGASDIGLTTASKPTSEPRIWPSLITKPHSKPNTN